ncbi:ileal sodium/bile acid cotransporter-like [Oratosquilla oratoria]|uniref:ileal sodium/bile acid cotransporter-like n=1 Tax=Oratosquilla oratoria TaxID=337810 RepID=UPI003F76D71C
MDEMIDATEESLIADMMAVNVTTFSAAAPSFIEPYRAALDLTATVVMTVNTINLMLGMGSATCWRELWHHLKKPIGCLIGMTGQFIVLPASGFGLAALCGLRPYEALGVLIVSCSPGGSFSNFFTYWCDGDLALSILMTACSSLVALGGMPFNLWLYSRYWMTQENEDEEPMDLTMTDDLPEAPGVDMPKLVIPYMNIIISLLFISIPVTVGMIIRHCNLRVANIITKVSTGFGWLGFLIVAIIWLLLYWGVFLSATKFIYLVAFLLPVVGFCLAYTLSKILCQDHRRCRTIGIETGSQNMPVALSIILLSFRDPLARSELILFPTLYGVTLLIEVFLGIGIFQCFKRIRPSSPEEADVELPEKHEARVEKATPAEKSNLI